MSFLLKDSAMKHESKSAITALLFSAAGFAAGLPPALAAEQPSAAAAYEADPRLQRHHRMAELMEQMQAQMGIMSKRMADPKLTEQERKSMSEDMKRMGSMMRRMSGLTDRASMRDADASKQMDEMQKQMEAMRKRHEQTAPAVRK
jgi:hypothetical protein